MKNNGYVWGAVIAVVLVGAFVLFRANRAAAPSPTASSTSMGTTTVSLGNGQTITLPPGAKLTEVDTTTSALQPPSLTGAISISSSLPADAQAALRTDEQATIAQLKSAPNRVDLWLQLGVDRKIGGDYAGAEAAWNYVAQTGPNTINYVAYGDLGDLYTSFAVNLPKAEASYKAAISINPTVIDYYRELFYLYGMEKNPTAQAAILAQGLKANPNNPDLLTLQQQTK